MYQITRTGLVFGETRNLLKIRWVGVSVGNQCIVQDATTGQTVWQESYLSGGSTPESDFTVDLDPVQGLTVAQIDAGTLFVFAR